MRYRSWARKQTPVNRTVPAACLQYGLYINNGGRGIPRHDTVGGPAKAVVAGNPQYPFEYKRFFRCRIWRIRFHRGDPTAFHRFWQIDGSILTLFDVLRWNLIYQPERIICSIKRDAVIRLTIRSSIFESAVTQESMCCLSQRSPAVNISENSQFRSSISPYTLSSCIAFIKLGNVATVENLS